MQWRSHALVRNQTMDYCMLTAALLHVLQSEAPETLQPPRAELFINRESYSFAMVKYDLYGHWASWSQCPPIHWCALFAELN